MGVVKKSGSSSWGSRRRTMHGSTAEWGRNKSQGKLMKWSEKPSKTGSRPGSKGKRR